jgi:hypothetical protein
VNETDVIYGTKEAGCDRPCYHREMSESTFCLNPLGWSPWTLRFYQALMTRCIPVMIADDIEFPFENEVNGRACCGACREGEKHCYSCQFPVGSNPKLPHVLQLDYTKMAIKIPEKDVDDIVSFLRNMPEHQKAAMRAEGDRHWLKFTYQRPPVEGDAFFATMRELARKVKKFRTSDVHAWH